MESNIKAMATLSQMRGIEILNNWLPDGKRQGSDWVALNPNRQDKNTGSFRVDINTGKWVDKAIGESGGDYVSLVAYLDGTNQGKAADELVRFLGESRAEDRRKKLTDEEISQQRKTMEIARQLFEIGTPATPENDCAYRGPYRQRTSRRGPSSHEHPCQARHGRPCLA